MQTHPDSDSPISENLRRLLYGDQSPWREQIAQEQFDRLEQRAKQMVENGESVITAGGPNEQPLAELNKFCVHMRRLPEDPDCLRISIGEARGPLEARYLVIRGDPDACANLLERCARALRSSVDQLRVRSKEDQLRG